MRDAVIATQVEGFRQKQWLCCTITTNVRERGGCTCTAMWFRTVHGLPACLWSVVWIKLQGTGKPSSLGLLVLEALKVELPWPVTHSSQLPEAQILDLLGIPFWLGKEGAAWQWQVLAFPLCLIHFLPVRCGFPKVWATHQSQNISLSLKV